MAISYLLGFGMGSFGEDFSHTAGGDSIQSAVTRPGSTGFSFKCTGATGSFLVQSRPAGGVLASVFLSVSFYIRIDALPAAGSSITLAAFGSGHSLALNPDGTLTSQLGSVNSTSAFTADSLWHHITWDVTAATSGLVYVDGTLWITDTVIPATFITQTNFSFGLSGASTTHVVYFSDFKIYNSSTAGPVADHALKLLIPTAGNNAGSWTDGAGGTGDIHGSVDNVPPVGVAAATAAAKIKNAVSGATLDYVATMQTYLAAGIPAGSVINAIVAICNDGEEISTGTKPGGIWCASNPAQSASSTSFDSGDDTATVVGTYPTGWATHQGVIAVAPSVTLSTAPTVTVRKAVASTRVVDVDFMGLYVDYTPPTSNTDPPFLPQTSIPQGYVPQIVLQ